MAEYKIPLKDMQFVLNDLLGMETALQSMPAYEGVDADIVAQVLEEAGKFASGVIAPLNAIGDVEGCKLNDDSSVTTPSGFREAYQKFVEGGWPGLSMSADYGGQGLPCSVQIAVNESLYGANAAWGLYIGLSQGAYKCLEACASEEIKSQYLPKLADGSWMGTMCLTEPQAGSDLSQVKTRAEPNGDGSYSLTGGKIFISAGEHDFSENILHLVLARLPDAPAGTRGISLFLVPRHLPDADNNPGERNEIRCVNLEHKMGIHGNATCVINMDGAKGWLIGEPNRGLANMFVMMNEARLTVGNEGLALSEGAYQLAAAYAKERIQSRSAAVPVPEGKVSNPIIDHPDVRKMLLTQRAYVEGGRAIIYWTALLTDVENSHADAAERERAKKLVEFLTPIAKGFVTDNGVLCTNLAIQCFGGYGFIHETGIEQYFRDVRIKTIYEGTNGIQALDLIGRKVLHDGGERLGMMIDIIKGQIAESAAVEGLSDHAAELGRVVETVADLTAWVAEENKSNPAESAAAATDYLRLVSHMVCGYLWLKMATVASRKLQTGQDAAFHQAKLTTAAFYFQRLLPEADAAARSARAGSAGLMAMPVEAF